MPDYDFNITTFIRIQNTFTRTEYFLEEIRELLISHIIKYQWHLKAILIQHLTIDLASQINHFIGLVFYKLKTNSDEQMDPNIINEIIAGTFTGNVNKALICASENGHDEVVKLLLKAGADPTVRDNYAIRWASERGHIEVVKLLLSAGADLTARDNLAIIYASENGHIDIIKLLLSAGADPVAQDNLAIKCASQNGHVEVIKLLLEIGADPAAEDNLAIKCASHNGHVEVIKLLLEIGADPAAEDNLAIKCASQNGHVEAVKLLFNSILHKLTICDYNQLKTTNQEIKQLWIDHIIIHRWIIKTFLREYLTIDLFDQIIQFIVT